VARIFAIITARIKKRPKITVRKELSKFVLLSCIASDTHPKKTKFPFTTAPSKSIK
jgi:hypothetical protein